MHWQFNPYVPHLVVAAGASVIVALLALRRRPNPGALALAATMLAAAWYGLGYALQIGSQDLRTMMLAVGIRYVGNVTVPAAWLLLAL
jgi:hypothetical protein